MKTGLVLANGPSILGLPTDICKGFDVTVGLSGLLLGYDGSTEWYPDPVPRNMMKIDIWPREMPKSRRPHLLREIESLKAHKKSTTLWTHEQNFFFFGEQNGLREVVWGPRGWTTDRASWDGKTLGTSRSSIYQAVQLCFLLGAQDIIVCGLDGYRGCKGSHFYGTKFSDDTPIFSSSELMDGTARDMKQLCEWLYDRGCHVRNANLLSKFPL